MGNQVFFTSLLLLSAFCSLGGTGSISPGSISTGASSAGMSPGSAISAESSYSSWNWANRVSLRPARFSPRPVMTVTPQDLRQISVRVGMEPGALAAAGVTQAQIVAAVGRMRDALAVDGPGLLTCDAAVDQCVSGLQAVEQVGAPQLLGAASAESDGAAQGDSNAVASGWNARESSLQQARQQRADVLARMQTNISQDLSDVTRQRLVTIQQNRTRGLPVQYLLADCSTEEQWANLRDAIVQRRVAQRLGQSVPPAAASLLATVEAQAPVAAAITRLNEQGAAIRSAWNQAMDGN